jgi:hypothetical protein
MPGLFLNAGASLTCPHGGSVTVTASSTRLTASGLPVVRVGDQHVVNGCPFTLNGVPQPCIRVVWGLVSGAAKRVTAQGQAVVLAEPGAGTCFDILGQPKGSPTVNTTQARVRGI